MFPGKLILTISIILFLFAVPSFADNNQTIHIATVGDMSGKNAEAGTSLVNGINLYLNEFAASEDQRAINIILDIYDDRNEKDNAKLKAEQILNDNKAVAVIGHHFSSSSISAGEIYKKHQIPAIL